MRIVDYFDGTDTFNWCSTNEFKKSRPVTIVLVISQCVVQCNHVYISGIVQRNQKVTNLQQKHLSKKWQLSSKCDLWGLYW